MLKRVEAGQLEIGYEESGSIEGQPTVLLRGFPYDVRAYDDVAAILADAGCRVIVPYLRGFGPTRFLSERTLRSGQQAALACDLLALMDALNISQPILAGYDWGGRALVSSQRFGRNESGVWHLKAATISRTFQDRRSPGRPR